MIKQNGPLLEALTTLHDDRGDLTEIVHNYDLPTVEYFRAESVVHRKEGPVLLPIEGTPARVEVPLQVGNFGQTYIVRNEQAMTIRAFHRHEKLWDFFTIVNGKARVWVVSPEGEARQFILSAAPMQRLTIPPGFWHGWQSLTPNTIMVCTGSEVYDRNKPDEERISYDAFKTSGVYWEVRPK